jgi:energy-coupling factor transporter ATP-binding protein EcfA2
MRRRGTISKVITGTRTDDLTVRLAHFAASLESLSIPTSLDRRRLDLRREWIVRTIRGYLIPRMENPLAPLTVVFAGPTGAGKSTLLNSVAGAEHSVAGPLRPTTKAPLVLASHGLAAEYTLIGGIHCHVVTGKAPILDELTLVDTPDIDSTTRLHRAIAETMIDNADVVVYVNSAQRYADLVPWEVLRRAHSRGAPVVHVLNRVTSASAGAVSAYASRLEEAGLGSDVVAVHEHRRARGAQAVPLVMIQALRDRLVGIVEERLSGKADVVMSVLDALLDQADDVITGIAGLTEMNLSATERSGLAFDDARLGAGVSPMPLGSLKLGALASLNDKRWRVRARVRRHLPPASAVARAHTFMEASLVAGVDADIRAEIISIGTVGPSEVDELVAGSHPAAVAALTDWRRDLEGLQLTRGSLDPGLTAFLLARSVVHGPDDTARDVLALLSGTDQTAGPVTRATEMLEARLAPVYQQTGQQLNSRVAEMVASEEAIYRARTSLSAVMARSSFANA